MTVQTQANDYDCGPFALAFAKSLADNCDPTQLNYINLRQHLYSEFVENKLEQFPSYPCQRRRKLVHKTIKKGIVLQLQGLRYRYTDDRLIVMFAMSGTVLLASLL